MLRFLSIGLIIHAKNTHLTAPKLYSFLSSEPPRFLFYFVRYFTFSSTQYVAIFQKYYTGNLVQFNWWYSAWNKYLTSAGHRVRQSALHAGHSQFVSVFCIYDILLKFENMSVIVTGKKRILSVTHEIVPDSDRRPAAISCTVILDWKVQHITLPRWLSALLLFCIMYEIHHLILFYTTNLEL